MSGMFTFGRGVELTVGRVGISEEVEHGEEVFRGVVVLDSIASYARAHKGGSSNDRSEAHLGGCRRRVNARASPQDKKGMKMDRERKVDAVITQARSTAGC